MSVSEDETFLTGDFIEIYQVDSLGTAEETETLLGHTHDEVTLSKDNEEPELQAHEQAATKRKRTHYTMDLEISVYVVPDIPELQTLGIVDENGEATNDAPEWECARMYAYDTEPGQVTDTTPQAVVEVYSVDWDFDELNFSVGDPGNIDMVGFVNGSWKSGKTEPPTTTTTT